MIKSLFLLIKFGFVFLRKRIDKIINEEIIQKDIFLTRYSSDKSRFPLLVLHGLSMKGRKDHRLVHFAESLSRIGFIVYALDLEYLKKLEFKIKDIDIINRGIKYIYQRENQKIGLIGFSIGGSYSLIYAVKYAEQNILKFVFAVGSYYLIDTLFTNMKKIKYEDPYGILVIAYNNISHLNLNNSELKLFNSIMNNYCEKKDCFNDNEKIIIKKIVELAGEKKLLEKTIKNLDKYEKLNLSYDNYLKNINTKVLLLHSENDLIIPAFESQKIYEKLKEYKKDVIFNMGGKSDHVNFKKGNIFKVIEIFYKMIKYSN